MSSKTYTYGAAPWDLCPGFCCSTTISKIKCIVIITNHLYQCIWMLQYVEMTRVRDNFLFHFKVDIINSYCKFSMGFTLILSFKFGTMCKTKLWFSFVHRLMEACRRLCWCCVVVRFCLGEPLC